MKTIALLSASSIALLATNTAEAQTAAPATASQAPDLTGPTGLSDIVVTATRRAVDLQQVPAVVQALPATQLKALNITGVQQLPTLVPGFIIIPSGGNNLYLRGIGSPSTGFNEAQVAVYLDGIYLANPAIGIYSFNNVDQIEVLKGPQGTLYGRNATGGLLAITTRDPGAKPRFDASVGYGNYNTLQLNGYASTPLGNDLAANVSVFHQNQARGYGINTFTGNRNLKTIETGVQAKLKWTPISTFKATANFIYDYNNRDSGYAGEIAPAFLIPAAPAGGTLASDGTPYLGKYRNAMRIDPQAPFTSYIGSVKLENDFGFASLVSTTAYQAADQNVLMGYPGTVGQPILPAQSQGVNLSATYNPFYEHSRTFTQELQLTSRRAAATRFDWVLGAYYFNDHQDLRLDSVPLCVGTTCGAGVPTRIEGYPSTFSSSAYADGTYRFFDATRLSVGLRYTSETKYLAGLTTPLQGLPDSIAAFPVTCSFTQVIAGCTVTMPGEEAAAAPGGIPTRLHFNKLTYRFVLAQDVGDNLHLYASHNLGFKSGAFNANSFTNPPVQPELLYDTEVGFKSEMFDRRLRLNVGYFHYIYKNVQVRSTAPPAVPGFPILLNVASEHVDGIDGDIAFAPTRDLVLTGSLEYLNARYADYPGTSCTTPGQKTILVNGVPLTVGYISAVTCNLAGKRVAYSSPFSASLGFVYTLDTARSGSFKLSANAHYTSRYPQASDGAIYQPSYALVDASLAWALPDQRYDVQLWVRNLTDRFYSAVASAGTAYSFVPGAPRTFGATVGVHF